MNRHFNLLALQAACAALLLAGAPHAYAQLRIATWNIAWLANKPLPDRAAVERCEAEKRAHRDSEMRAAECRGNVFRMAGAYSALAAYARTLDADVVALQEVEGEEALARIFDTGEYEFRVSRSPGRQRTAFAVRRKILASRPQFRDVAEIGAPQKERPRYGLEALLPLAGGSSLRLLNVHLKSFCHTVALTTDTEDCRILAAQVPPLEAWIDEAHRRGGPFIVLGDMNRVFDVEGPQARVSGRTANMWPEIDDNDPGGLRLALLTRGQRHSADCLHRTHNGKSPYFIDHFIAGGEAIERIAGPVTELPYKVLASDERARHVPRRFLSDHCAIWVHYQP